MRSSRTGRRVGLLAFDGVMLLDLSGPAEVFVAANRQVPHAYEVQVLSPAGGAFATSVGAPMVAAPVAGSGVFDTVLVIGSAVPAARFVTAELVRAARDLAGRTRRLGSICTGTFVLAEAGLLDGRSATTHWKFARDLAVRYPRVAVRPDAIYVRDELVYSSGGASAGIDLALALVEEDLGADVAQAIARDLLVYLQRGGGQSQFSPSVVGAAGMAGSSLVRRVTDHVRATPQEAHTVRSMAAHVHLSVRQLTRLFRDELGTTPASYVADLRFGIACDRLRAGASVAGAAAAAGFSSSEIMRRTFAARLGCSPRDYRAAAASDVPNRGVRVASGGGAGVAVR